MSKQVLRSFSLFLFFPRWLFLWRCFIRTVMGMSGRETLTISKSKAKRHTMPRCRNRWWPQKKRHFGWGIVCILGQLSVFVLIVAFVKRHLSNLLSYFFHLPIYQTENDLLLCVSIAYATEDFALDAANAFSMSLCSFPTAAPILCVHGSSGFEFLLSSIFVEPVQFQVVAIALCF